MPTLLVLLKPRYHASFLTIGIGALLFAEAPDRALAVRLAVLYISFNVLLYGGIYTFNDIADRGDDARHPRKALRPIASGRIGVKTAAALAAALCVAGITMAAALLPAPILGCYAAILALNAAYSGGGRAMPVLDVALNAAPHAVRFLMGALLVGRVPPPGHLAAWLCLAAGISCVRRLVEKQAGGDAARPVLRHYTVPGLALAADAGFAGVAVFAALDGMASPGFYAIVTSGYLLLVVSARRVPVAHGGFERLWLR
jgi:4-hydroxybenzoate polyprenyltransferase